MTLAYILDTLSQVKMPNLQHFVWNISWSNVVENLPDWMRTMWVDQCHKLDTILSSLSFCGVERVDVKLRLMWSIFSPICDAWVWMEEMKGLTVRAMEQ
jgi:hypothetical protein